MKWEVVIFVGIVTVLGTLYYLINIFDGSSLAGQAERSFIPKLLLNRQFWKALFEIIFNNIGLAPIVIALFGIPLLRWGVPTALIVGLWMGYIVFVLFFTRHTSMTGYYHLQVVVPVAISLGVVIATILEQIRAKVTSSFWLGSLIGALVLMAIGTILQIRNEFSANNLESYQTSQQIGKIVNHSDRVVYVSSYYGRPLEYLGELSGTFWPVSSYDWRLEQSEAVDLGIAKRIELLGFAPEYFVITDFDGYRRRHKDLAEYLTENCSLLAEAKTYQIFDKCLY